MSLVLNRLERPLRAEYRAFTFGDKHVRVCFFLGRVGTSDCSVDDAMNRLHLHTEYGPVFDTCDKATVGLVVS